MRYVPFDFRQFFFMCNTAAWSCVHIHTGKHNKEGKRVNESAGKEKRKNDQRRPFQWWLLVVGVIIGAVVMLLVVQQRTQPVNMSPPVDIALTATYVVEQATLMVQDPLQLTATHIVEQLTATVVSQEAAGREGSLMDPIAQTATHIIEMATQQAANP